MINENTKEIKLNNTIDNPLAKSEKYKEKFSYSKLEVYESCSWRYKLIYEDKNFIKIPSIATDFGTLIHFIEESLAKDIIKIQNEDKNLLALSLDYDYYIDKFITLGLDENKSNVIGIKKIKENHLNDFYEKDKQKLNYNDKANIYLNDGIFRLQKYLLDNPDLEIIDVEREFNLNYNGFIFHGFIDRILRNNKTGTYIVEDIKTWSAIDKHSLITPLQFVIYVLAMKDMFPDIKDENSVECYYDLPLTLNRYKAGTKNFIKRGKKKIDKILEQIKSKDFKPNPSPLCYWCPFSKNFPNQLDEAKYLCPYYCKWTKSNNDFSVEYEFMGIDNDEDIRASFKEKCEDIEKQKVIEVIRAENNREALLFKDKRIFIGKRR